MNGRLTGNHGVQRLGVASKKKKNKAKRTPVSNFVLGALVSQYLDELAAQRCTTRAEMVRTLIVRAHMQHIGGGVYED